MLSTAEFSCILQWHYGLIPVVSGTAFRWGKVYLQWECLDPWMAGKWERAFSLENVLLHSTIEKKNLTTGLGSVFALGRLTEMVRIHADIYEMLACWRYSSYVRSSSSGNTLHKVQGQGSSSGNVEETTKCLIVQPLYQPPELQRAV